MAGMLQGRVVQVVEQERGPCAGSCLPLTCELARVFRPLLEALVRQHPTSWSFEDRVVAILSPSLVSDIARFYEEDGVEMARLFRAGVLEHLDQSMLRELATRLEALSPGCVLAAQRQDPA